MPGLEIRRADVADAPVLAGLHRHVHDPHLEAEPDVYRRPTAEEVLGWFEEHLRIEGTEAYVADDGGEACGYVVMKIEYRVAHVFVEARSRVLVDQLAVAPSARRRGVGRALMDTVHTRAAVVGVPTVELGVRAFNESAQRFYAALGYAPLHITMRRPVDA